MGVYDLLNELDKAFAALDNGGVVVFPTDTLYGLGADVFSLPALRRIFAIKGRPAELALPVLVAGLDQVESVALPMRRSPELPDLVTGGADTVAVRMPAHRIPLALARRLGRPITGTSANLSGQPDLLDLDSIENQLGNLVDYIIRSGPPPEGTGATVVDITRNEPRLLREGAISLQEIMETAG